MDNFLAGESYIYVKKKQLPILAEVDLVVFGGSFAGVKAAKDYAKKGFSVMLIESRTYLGQKYTANLCPWVAYDEEERQGILNLPGIHGIDNSTKQQYYNQESSEEMILKPDNLKLALENALLENGVKILYASFPTAVYKGDKDFHYALVIGNKSGRQVIKTRQIIDSSDTQSVLRVVEQQKNTEGYLFEKVRKESISRKDKKIYRRVLEFTGVTGLNINKIKIPKKIGILNNKVIIHSAYYGDGHILVEYSFKVLLDKTIRTEDIEYMAREKGFQLAHYLISEVPEFRNSYFADGSNEVFSPHYEVNNIEITKILDEYKGSGNDLSDRQQIKQNSDPNRLECLEIESPQRGKGYESFQIPAEKIPVLKEVDVLVVGGGSSGFQAALSSGREGVQTALIDYNPGPGGTGTYGGVDSYWFGRKVSFSRQIDDKLKALQDKINHNHNKWNISVREYLIWKELREANVDLYFNTIVIGTLVSGKQVKGVIIATRQGVYAVTAQVVIDATGDGDLAAFAGAEYTYGSAGDHSIMWYSLAQFSEPGKTRNNFTSSVDVSNIEDYTRAILAGRRRKRDEECYDHGIYPAPRESRHIKGKYILTQTDQLKQRKWHDVINIHFSNTDIKGKSSSIWMQLGLIPPNLEIEIPYRLLLPENLTGILVTGKAISVTHDALAPVRMQADLENLGGVTGIAAALAVKNRVLPDQLEVRKLQEILVDKGILPDEVIRRNNDFYTETDYHTEEELKELIKTLTAEKPLYAYSNMEMDQVFKGKIPFVEVCTVGERIVPYLLEELKKATGKRKLMIAQALAVYRQKAGLPILEEEILKQLSNGSLPVRDSHILYAGTPPDQAAMPDIVYLLYSIALVPDRRNLEIWKKIVDLIPENGDYTDGRLGLFYYVNSVCYGMERYAGKEAIPVLEKLHTKDDLKNQVLIQGFQVDYIPERKAMLELAIGRALASCNSKEGYQILFTYLHDTRALLAEGAHTYLIKKTGQDFGKNKDAWVSYLDRCKDILD